MTDRTDEWAVDQQLHSPLFGKLPAEIRENIFKFVLEECYDRPVRHNFRLRYDHDGEPDDDDILNSSVESAEFTDSQSEMGSDDDGEDNELEQRETNAELENNMPFNSIEFNQSEDDDSWYAGSDVDSDQGATGSSWQAPIHNHLLTWLRPGTLGMPKIDTSLLRTCRRAYLETRDILGPNTVLHIWANDAPQEDKSEAYDATASLYHRLTPRQRDAIASAHLHCHELFKTGPKGLWGLCMGPQRLLRRIEHLRVSVSVPRYTFPMFWDPYRPDAAGPTLRENMRRTADFGHGDPPPETPDAEWQPPVTWGVVAWADVFRYLPSLRTFTMDFDADVETRDGVEEVVEWASRVWRFPLGPRPDNLMYLSAQGIPVEKTSWRGPPCFPRPCAECPDIHAQGLGPDGECSWSARQIVLLEKGVGERIYTWTVRWTARVGKEWVRPGRVGRWPVGLPEVGAPDGCVTWDDSELV